MVGYYIVKKKKKKKKKTHANLAEPSNSVTTVGSIYENST